MKHIEIVVPCFNEQECIGSLFYEIKNVFRKLVGYSFSILYVDDGSKDGTLTEIRSLAEKYGNDQIRYISFSRNFGKESSIYAGFLHCKGDYIVLMDADLQHPPELLPEMIHEIEKGHDCCGARRISRQGEPLVRSFFSRLFYRIINHITQIQLVPGGSDYRIMKKQMVEAVVALSERERFTKGIFSWVGFDTVWIPYENVERYAGESKWSFFGLVRYAWNGFLAFATTPLRAVIYLGMMILMADIVFAAHVFFMALPMDSTRTGFSTIVLLLLFFGGFIILILGLIGEYLVRIYLELKHRPIYISKETNIKKGIHNGQKEIFNHNSSKIHK